MPHGRCTWTCMRHYQSKPRCISGEFIRQKAPSNLKKKMHEGWVFLSFPKPRHKSSSHIKEPWTHPTWFSLIQQVLQCQRQWPGCTESHQKEATRGRCLPVLPPIQNMGQRGSWLLQRRAEQKALPALGTTRSPHIMIYDKSRAGTAEPGLK